MKPYHYISKVLEDQSLVDSQRARSLLARGIKDEMRDFRLLQYDALSQAIKFSLPYGGKILDISQQESSAAIGEFGRLPYPVIAIEYFQNCGNTGDNNPLRQGPSYLANERVLLCVETEKNIGKRILVSMFLKMYGAWEIYDCSIFISPTGGPMATDFIPNWGLSGGFKDVATIRNAWSNYDEEVAVIGNLLAALACKNVHQVTLPAPKRLNKKREAKKKTPLFEYKFLEIDVGKEDQNRGIATGTHASPRVHLRRGHIRRLPSGDRIWVNAAIVGSKQAGMLHKDYGVAHSA